MIHGRKPALDLDRGCRDPVNAYSAHPTGKSIGVDHFVVASARRAEQSRPLLEVQSRSADEIAALLHYRLHVHRHIQRPVPFAPQLGAATREFQ
jgi:hypothetical protein